MNTLKTELLATALCGFVALGATQRANAGPNLVQNGDFSLNGGTGQIGYNTTLTDWANAPGNTSPAYNFVFAPGSAADSTGAANNFGNVTSMYGPGNPNVVNGVSGNVANGFTPSPAGGTPNIVGLDSYLSPGAGAQVDALQQTITGLTPGQTYALSFYWASAQQVGFTGVTTNVLAVSLGGVTQDTAPQDNASEGFVPWAKVTFDYTATSSSELLSFLAEGAPPVTEPPFVLLDDVVLTQTQTAPDATSTVALFGIAATTLGIAARRFGRQCRQ